MAEVYHERKIRISSEAKRKRSKRKASIRASYLQSLNPAMRTLLEKKRTEAESRRELVGGSLLKLFHTIKQLSAVGVLCWLAAGAIPDLSAQQQADPPVAPVPAQILTGKTVFVSNASGQGEAPAGVPDLTYNEFYADIKNWGRYEIVAAPADADLVFEIRFTSEMGTTSVINGNGGSGRDFQFRLVILDPKTRTVLWAFTEYVPQAANHAASRKKFDDAMATILNDVKKLANPVTPASGASTK